MGQIMQNDDASVKTNTWYTVSEAAHILQISAYTIRYYTNLDLVPGVRRDEHNRRLFDVHALRWLRGIMRLKECGMSIKELQRYCRLCLSDEDTFSERYAMIRKCHDNACESLRRAQSIADFAERKLRHYTDIKEGKRADDTDLSIL